MGEDKTIEILKKAILLEKRGQAFYGHVAQQASGKAVKKFFELLADEELEHIKILSDQFKTYRIKETFDPRNVTEDQHAGMASRVLTQEIKAEIAAADYEASAIAAAMSMEEKAIELYAERAQETDDPNEKALYEWLTTWERQHLQFLTRIDRELKEEIWNDNAFWPF